MKLKNKKMRVTKVTAKASDEEERRQDCREIPLSRSSEGGLKN